nr:DNA mismatch repair endonuclease MutL [Chloroflexota bacterium]
ALPSVAAVSVLTIRSATGADAHGAELRVDFGVLGGVKSVAAAPGTTVRVDDLFGNVPVRRKFLRQTATESGYIVRIVGAYAAAYPEVRFTLVSDGRRLLATDGAGIDESAAIGVFGPELAGATLILPRLDPESAVPGVQVEGWVGAPQITRAHRQHLQFFVNGRWVQHRGLSFALEEAFHTLLMVGRHPLGIVRIMLSPDAIDVNVHPSKAEIKFVDERAGARAVRRATHAALGAAPRGEPPSFQFSELPTAPPGQFVAPQTALHWQATRDALPSQVPPVSDKSDFEKASLPILRVLGQIGATYIIAEGPTGMFLIDQHAAHERILFEQLAGRARANQTEVQSLLEPLVVELPLAEMEIFERSREELTQVGFEIEPFGESSVAVRGVPAAVRGVDITERLHLILRELAEGGAGDSWLDSVAISAACHTSIRAGQALSLPEMRELVMQLERTQQPRACGHGRPTMLHLTPTDLERQFARR